MARPQVNIRVNEDQKDRWETYVEDSHEHDTLTDLIRVSVEREIAAEGGSRAVNPKGGGSDERIGEVLTAVKKMQGQLEDLEGSVSKATDAMHASNAGSDDFSTEVFSELPVGEENAISAREMAMRLGVEDGEARGVLEQLRSQTNVVRRVEQQLSGQPEHIYYRVD